MMIFRSTTQRSALLYELNREVSRHQYNLERAFKGQTPFFVPASGDRQKIRSEEERLASILNGIILLGGNWQVKPLIKTDSQPLAINPLLYKQALYSTALMVLRSKTRIEEMYHRTDEEIHELEELVRYIDCKLGQLSQGSEICPDTIVYSSLGTQMGYVMKKSITREAING
jgi:hypothetical protein